MAEQETSEKLKGRIAQLELELADLRCQLGAAGSASGDHAAVDGDAAAYLRLLKSNERLQNSLETLENIIEASLDAIVVLDRMGKISRVNTAFELMLGYGKEEIIGDTVLAFSQIDAGRYESTSGEIITIGADHYQAGIEMTSRLFDEGSVSNHEAFHIRRDRKLVPVEQNIVLLYDERGERTGAMAFVRDITERRRSDQELKASRDFLENVFKTTGDGIFVTDYDGLIVRANTAIAEMLGLQEAELAGMHYAELYAHRLQRGAASEMQDLLISQGYVHDFESSYRRRDGSIFPVEINITCLKDEGGEVLGTVCAVRDITERKQAEADLLASEERFRSIFEDSPIGIALYDEAFELIHINATCMNLFGIAEREEVLGSRVLQDLRVPDEVKDQVRNGDAARFETSFDFQVLRERNLFKTTRSGVCFFDVLITPRGMKPDATPAGFLLHVQEITGRREMERQLRSARDDLGRQVQERTRSLEDANTALKVLLQRRDTDKAALENRVLFNVNELVMPYIEKLKSCKLGERPQGYVDILATNINDIVTPFVRAGGSQELKLTPTEIQIANLVKQGRATKDIAGLLGLSEKTIAFHRDNIRKKFGLKNRKVNLRTYLLSIQ